MLTQQNYAVTFNTRDLTYHQPNNTPQYFLMPPQVYIFIKLALFPEIVQHYWSHLLASPCIVSRLMRYFERAGRIKGQTYAHTLLYQLVKRDLPCGAQRKGGDLCSTMVTLITICISIPPAVETNRTGSLFPHK
jgi:hypothetical protein